MKRYSKINAMGRWPESSELDTASIFFFLVSAIPVCRTMTKTKGYLSVD